MLNISISGIPLFNILKKEAREKGGPAGRAEFARQQRESLENYLIGLVKAVVRIFPSLLPFAPA